MNKRRLNKRSLSELIHENNETAHDAITDLATGQTGFAEGVRLRIALLFDRRREAEYADLRRLRNDMRSLGTASEIPLAPLWPAPDSPLRSAPTITWGKFTMKRRNVLAAYAALLLTMTGAALARQWASSRPAVPTPRRIADHTGKTPTFSDQKAVGAAIHGAGRNRQSDAPVRLAHILAATIPLPTPDDEHPKPFTPEEAKQKTEAALTKIEGILADIRAGRITFEAAAVKYSDDRANAAKGGDLGLMSPGQLDPEFEKAAFGIANVGEIAGPVKTAFGYHLIKLLARNANAAPAVGGPPAVDEKELAARYAPGPEFPMKEQSGDGARYSTFGLINSYSKSYGFSYKLIGYAKVTLRYAIAPKYTENGESLVIDWAAAEKRNSRLENDLRSTLAPKRNVVPILYWTRADRAEGKGQYPVENGWWKSVRQTGELRGYGEYTVKDESGNVFVTITIAPLKAKT